jgi:WSC domain
MKPTLLLCTLLQLSTFAFATPKPVPTVYNPGGKYTYLGCYSDLVNNVRDLSHKVTDSGGCTVESCLASCSSLGYTLAGVESSVYVYINPLKIDSSGG